MKSVTYPATQSEPGRAFSYTYDEMGRPVELRDDQATPLDWVWDVVYNAAGQITSMKRWTGPTVSDYWTEMRTYNGRQQLTWLRVTGYAGQPQADLQYIYSATQNNGRIEQSKDWVSGEEVVYQYDSLNRLASAETPEGTSGPEWGQSFGYL